jgi:hypothetical protein
VPVNPVHGVVGIFYGFFLRKIIKLILKIVGTLEFCKGTLNFFIIIFLVPVILHLGPCLTFYNYNLVIFLINLLILITYLIY